MCPLIHMISCQLLPWSPLAQSVLMGEQITATLLQETGLLLLARVASVMLRSRYSFGQLNSLQLNEMDAHKLVNSNSSKAQTY